MNTRRRGRGGGRGKHNPTVDLKMMVSVPGGPDALIKQKGLHHCKDTLGV